MNAINQLIIEATCIKDAETKETTKCVVSEVTVAHEREYRNAIGEISKEINYFDIVCFGEYFAKAMQKCKKGTCIRCVGRMKQERWKNSEGKTCSKVYIIAEHIDFLKADGKTQKEVL